MTRKAGKQIRLLLSHPRIGRFRLSIQLAARHQSHQRALVFPAVHRAAKRTSEARASISTARLRLPPTDCHSCLHARQRLRGLAVHHRQSTLRLPFRIAHILPAVGIPPAATHIVPSRSSKTAKINCSSSSGYRVSLPSFQLARPLLVPIQTVPFRETSRL